MREVKFRFLDAEGRFHYGSLEDIIAGKFISWSTAGCALEVQPPQQFTGLHDKNGKEIYEGDIVIDHHSVFMKYPKWKFEVKFWEGKFTPISSLSSGNYEVIGNIYENPKLLEDSELEE